MAGVRGAAGGARRRSAPEAGHGRETGQVQGEEVQGLPALQDQQAPHVTRAPLSCGPVSQSFWCFFFFVF